MGRAVHVRRSLPLVHSRSLVGERNSRPSAHGRGATASTGPSALVPFSVPSLTHNCRPLAPSVASNSTKAPLLMACSPRSRPGMASPFGWRLTTIEVSLGPGRWRCSSQPLVPSFPAKTNPSRPSAHTAASQPLVIEFPVPLSRSVTRSERRGSKQKFRVSRTSSSSNRSLLATPSPVPSSTPKRTTKPSAQM